MPNAACCERNLVQGRMYYLNCRNIYASIIVLAVVPTVAPMWVSLYFDTIWRETLDFLAVCNVTGLAIKYYNNYLGNGYMYISQHCLEAKKDLARK